MLHDLFRRYQAGEYRALARIITKLENDDPQKEELMRQLFSQTGQAYILGVTGSPGSGKSSLVDSLTVLLRKREEKVGIVAVDPTSPFTGGALLGDRIRMQDHAVDKGVFIRSMGTRGSLGGLSYTTKEVVKAMDAFGFSRVIVETVGVGQAELDIMHVADSVIVVLTPGTGDSIQAIKAGIMEIADVFAINKSDLPGADKIAYEVEMMLDLQEKRLAWRPSVIKTSTVSGEGLEDLLSALEKHRSFLAEQSFFQKRREDRLKSETLDILDRQWQQLVRKKMIFSQEVNNLLDSVAKRKIDPYTAAASILKFVVVNSGIQQA